MLTLLRVLKPGDTLKLAIHGSSVALTSKRQNSGFVRKGKALVFTAAAEGVLTTEGVESTLMDCTRGTGGFATEFLAPKETAGVKIFLDTSVLVSAVVEEHENHARSFPCWNGVQNEKDEGFVAGHALAEIYAVLTKLPQPFRHSPEQAILSIEENILRHFKLVVLTGADYAALVREAALLGVQGGTIYDALLFKCAVKSEAERIISLNVEHFRTVAPEALASVSAP
ncbi:MAG TPA: PIN domain-containing protein [Verrucomicrobiae bacterium]|nr:PIN domain-containing protein [Verrucomicrobiae bacterium]